MTSNRTLIASFALCAAVAGANPANAEGFSFGGGSGKNGNSKSSFKFNFNGNNNGNGNNQNKLKNGSPFKKYVEIYTDTHKANHKDKHCRIRYIQPVQTVYGQCYHPQFCCCYVYPGDTWYSISKRAYGVGFLSRQIALYNGLPTNSPLLPGQMLRLPVVNANGTMAASNAPMPAPYTPFASGGVPVRTYAATTHVGATETTAATAAESAFVQVPSGSTLMLDIETLGTDKGSARLRIASLTLPVEVLEWTTSSVKIELPKMELSGPVKAHLEVLRSDGTLASSSGIELTPVVASLAAVK